MEFTAEEKKELNKFLDDYEYLLKEGDYVTFLKKYRERNQNTLDALYYRFVELVEDSFNLNIEWFIKNDPDFYWIKYFGQGSNITHINIPTGVTRISSRAFLNCSNLKTVSISENSQLIEIGGYAFFNCPSLTSINIPDSVTSIQVGAFSHCSSLTTVTISENSQLAFIGPDAFYNCSSLTSIYIPGSVTKIGTSAFEKCSNLTIYCEAASKPSGWNSSWNDSNRPVVWGV